MEQLIHGAEVKSTARGNRGAELMLREVARRVRGQGHAPAALFRRVDRSLVEELGLHKLVGGPRVPASRFVAVPGLVTAKLGVITDGNLGAVLDASGFALGDQWGPHVAEWLARKFEYWAKAGIPVVLLPQAMGPFTDTQTRPLALRALKAATYVWARDPQSYASAVELLGHDGTVGLAPDLTIADGLHVAPNRKRRRLVVIPNANVLRSASGAHGDYVATLEAAIRWGRARDLDVVGLLHEGAGDLALLQALAQRTSIPIVADLGAIGIKRYLAESSLIVSGRFHGVVSGLSCGVPTLVHSWSHKYAAVLEDFGRPGWLANPLSVEDTLRVLDVISQDSGEGWREASAGLNRCRDEMATRVESMWQHVWGMVG